MVTITLPADLETVVSREAARKGTTAELLTLGVLQEQFMKPEPVKVLPDGATLADALGDYIGAINTADKYPEGSVLSENTGRRFGNLIADKRKRGSL